MPISPSIILSHSASSANSTGTLIQKHNPPAESDATQMVELPPQSFQHATVPRILTWRRLHSQKRPVDTCFMASVGDIQRQNGTNSRGSTPPASLILPRFSYTSFAASYPLSVASLPPVVEFPPTPAFKDEIPQGIMQMVKVNSARLLESDHLHRSTIKPAPLMYSPPAQTQPKNTSNNTNAVAKIGAGP